tara:strand:+ start:223 stop:1689 length:1467 start_codon:yes stop_codon:yes gene_type:complete
VSRSLSKSKVEDFEPKKKNPLGLLNDSNLDSELKTLLVGGEPTGVELSKDKTKINTDLEVEQLIGNIRATGGFYMDDTQKLVLNNNSDSLFTGNTYISASTGTATNHLDFYVGGAQIARFTQGALAVESITAYDSDLLLTKGHKLIFDSADSQDYIEVDDAAGSDWMYFYLNNTEVLLLKEDGEIFFKNDFSLDASTDNHIDFQEDGSTRFIVDSDEIAIPATHKASFDGVGGHTYIAESSDDVLDFYVGTVLGLQISEATTRLNIPATWGLYFDGGTHTYIEETSDDVLEFVVGADEMLILDEGNQRVTIEADKISYKIGSGGNEYSVANSAYAGTIIGYTSIGEDSSHAAYTLTTSYAVPDSDMNVSFVAPPSGKVELMVQVHVNSSTSGRYKYFGLSDNATYNSIGVQYEQVVSLDDETDDQVRQVYWTITGLTAGTTYKYWFGAKSNLTTAYLNWGGNSTGRYCDFIMKVVALPEATTDFAVYS